MIDLDSPEPNSLVHPIPSPESALLLQDSGRGRAHYLPHHFMADRSCSFRSLRVPPRISSTRTAHQLLLIPTSGLGPERVTGHDLSPRSSQTILRRDSHFRSQEAGRRIWSALRAIFAFEMPKASAPRHHQRNGGCECKRNKPPTPMRNRGLCRADFFGASPVASALGIRSGATPRGNGRGMDSAHSSASAVASSSTASSTLSALRCAARRNAVMASLLTLRGMPLVA